MIGSGRTADGTKKSRLLDTVLDRSVIGGYSRWGYAVRAASWPTDDPRPGALRGRTVAVTGATSGIGAAIAAGAVELGGRAILVGRDRDRAERVRADLVSRWPYARVDVALGDVADPDQVSELAERLAAHGVDVLIHNAGVMPTARTESPDGHELSLATHVLGPVRLTDALAPVFATSADPRVIFMSSGGMYTTRLPVGDIEYRLVGSGGYRGARAYARSKRIQTELLPILAARWARAGATVAGMHPGWVDTPGVSASLPRFARFTAPLLRSAEQGADTAVWLAATAPRPPTGRFWHDRRPRPLHWSRPPHSRPLSGGESSSAREAERRDVWWDVCAAAGIEEELS